jgi:uncharacterized protein
MTIESSSIVELHEEGIEIPSVHKNSPQGYIFETKIGKYLFIISGSRIYRLNESLAYSFEQALYYEDHSRVEFLLKKYMLGEIFSNAPPNKFKTVHSISLAVAQKCNLGCTYCYAQNGQFGGTPKNMPQNVALKAIKNVIDGVSQGEHINIAFMGGEPLLNRSTVHAASEFAHMYGKERGIRVGFSITTNGTLITAEDGDFFEKYGFAVTISIDGIGNTHDQQRGYRDGKGSYDQILENITPLLVGQRRSQISARVTVTPRNLSLSTILSELVNLGFYSVGFSPMLSSPTGRDEMDSEQLGTFLEQMIQCGQACEKQLIAGLRYPFSNLITALMEIHKGSYRQYPCGAGASYVGVSAEGNLFACHRFIDDKIGSLGNIDQGMDISKQAGWLAARQVIVQQPCVSCWARHLCGGGCHHEVINRGRPACNYIRGWLHYCLQTYTKIVETRPDFFKNLTHH